MNTTHWFLGRKVTRTTPAARQGVPSCARGPEPSGPPGATGPDSALFVWLLFPVVIALFALAIVVVVPFIPVFGFQAYRRGRRLEAAANPKDACYAYGTAILNGSPTSRRCRARIKALWASYGPFDYSDVEREIERGDTQEGCGRAGHEAVLSILRECVGPHVPAER